MLPFTQAQALHYMNALGKKREPFFFVIAYDTSTSYIIPLKEASANHILYASPTFSYLAPTYNNQSQKPFLWESIPPSLSTYQQQFSSLFAHLKAGTITVANLTCKSKVVTSLTLKEIFYQAKAPYRLWLYNQKNSRQNEPLEFVSFSPEPFLNLKGKMIQSFPMKGTIDATLPKAKQQLLENLKEKKEHDQTVQETIQSIALVAKEVHIARHRFITPVQTHQGLIYQMSSEVRGRLINNFHEHLGSIFFKLLPASSITGSPRATAFSILKTIETYDRGFYTGVAGYYDGKKVESFVLIRFLETIGGDTFFKSGGGITRESDPTLEYNEMCQKIYAPIY